MSFTAVSLLGGLLLERIIMCVASSPIRFLLSKFKKKNNKEANKSSYGTTSEDILLSLPKIANNLKPKVLLASLAVWTFLLSTNFVWNLDFRLTLFKLGILVALALITFLFLSTHLTTFIGRKLKACKVFCRILFIGIIATLYSFMIGAIGMAVTGEKHFLDDETLYSYCSGFTHQDSISKLLLNQSGNCLVVEKKIGQDSPWQHPFYDVDTIRCTSVCSKRITTCKGILDTALVLHNLYHYDRRNEIIIKRRVCFVADISTEVDAGNKGMSIKHKTILVVEPLIFFTFIAVALGLMLEMGLQLQRTGVDELN